jgi:PAS domain S-box-containing protein
MRRISEPKLIVGFVLIFCVLCANAFVLASNMRTVIQNRHAVERSHEVTAALDELLSTVQDAETGQRGFLLTGEKEYLRPYIGSRAIVDQRVARLRQLTKDDASQQPRISSIQREIEAKLSELGKTVLLQQQGRASEAITEVLSDRGMHEMDNIRALIIQMKNSERQRLAIREQESKSSEQTTLATFTGATAICLALLIVVYIVIVRSVEVRRRAADAVQKREEWLSTTLRSIGDAVIATDATGAVLFMNLVAEQLTGWKQEDAVGKDASQVFGIVNETTRDTVRSPIRQVIEENQIVALANHTVLIARDGSETFIDDSAAPIHDSAGETIGVVLVFRDISERKNAQALQERHLKELEALNTRLHRSITETNHRVKNNLQLIASMVQLKSEEGDGTLSAEEVNRLETNITTLAAVQDVLTIASRQEGGLSDISTKDILEKLIPIHQQSAARHKITANLVDIRLPGSQSTALALLANELLSNATKHGKSKVDFSMHLNAARDTLEMVVSDDGPGFPDGFDPLKAANTGLELIVSLAKWDLQGELSFENGVAGGEVRLRMGLSTPNK